MNNCLIDFFDKASIVFWKMYDAIVDAEKEPDWFGEKNKKFIALFFGFFLIAILPSVLQLFMSESCSTRYVASGIVSYIIKLSWYVMISWIILVYKSIVIFFLGFIYFFHKFYLVFVGSEDVYGDSFSINKKFILKITRFINFLSFISLVCLLGRLIFLVSLDLNNVTNRFGLFQELSRAHEEGVAVCQAVSSHFDF